MKQLKILLQTTFLFSLWIVFTSCQGQKPYKTETSEESDAERFDTVKALGDSVWYIYQDKKGNYWFGSNGEGVFRYDGKFILNFTTRNGLCSDSIRQIQEDEHGNIYFSTMCGINKFDGDDYIYYSSIVEDDDGAIWLTTWSQGVYKYDGKNIVHYAVKNGLSDVNLVSMYKDNQGNLWLGTPESGVYKFNGSAFERFIP